MPTMTTAVYNAIQSAMGTDAADYLKEVGEKSLSSDGAVNGALTQEQIFSTNGVKAEQVRGLSVQMVAMSPNGNNYMKVHDDYLLLFTSEKPIIFNSNGYEHFDIERVTARESRWGDVAANFDSCMAKFNIQTGVLDMSSINELKLPDGTSILKPITT